MGHGKGSIGALLLLAALGAAAEARAETCRASGGQGDWRYDCAADSCTLRPTRVAVENQHGLVEDDGFPLRFVLAPSPGIAVSALPDSPADRLEISYGGDALATLQAGADGGFALGQGKTLVDIGHALEAGKRLLLVFVDTSLAVNTAVAALGHEGFGATLAEAVATSDAFAEAAREQQPCP